MRRFTLPKKVVIPAVMLAIIIVLFGILFGANEFFNKYQLVFQSPIQSPVLVHERETKIISPVVSVKADQKKNNDREVKAVRIVPVAEAKEIESPKFIASSATEEKIAHYISENFGEDHVEPMMKIFQHESGTDPCKINGGAVDCNYQGEKACGLGQALPCSKLRNICPDLSDVDCQMKFWVGYVKGHGYGTPEAAWAEWQAKKWW